MGAFEKRFPKRISCPWHDYETNRRNQEVSAGDDEQLFTAWERFEDALLKCLEHKFNKLEQIQIFYNGLKLDARRMLDSQEPIPKMTACEGMKRIEEIARHSAMWHEDEGSPSEVETITKNIREFELEVHSLTEQVKTVEHSFSNQLEGRVSNIEKVTRKLMRDSDKKTTQQRKDDLGA